VISAALRDGFDRRPTVSPHRRPSPPKAHKSSRDLSIELQTIQLTKLEVARRQLHTAIELWFEERDAVSVYSLAYAAHEVISAVCKSRGLSIDKLLYESPAIPEDLHTEWREALRQPANFFKHGDRDPDGDIEFFPQAAEAFMITAIAGLRDLGFQAIDLEVAFGMWMGFNRIELKPGAEDPASRTAPETLAKIRAAPRPKFLSAFFSALGKMGVQRASLQETK
jgi:hypothetical protein